MTEQRFGKYIIQKRLGIGGMAEVFQCRLQGIGGFDKTVVVKRILPDHLDDPGFVQMFLDEARIAAHLSHPNIIQVFEIDRVDGIPYIAMEYLRGPTLSQVLRETRKLEPMPIGPLTKIVSSVCQGLHYAHNATDRNGQPLHIVHRDVTPQNILVTIEGVPKIVDFGVAKARGRLATTQAGVLKGKLRYMPPEQLEGAGIDHRVDVFAAGVCLYRATTGKFPFDGKSEPEIIRAIMDKDCFFPSELVPGFPPELERLILWALEKDPAERCPTALTLHEGLEAFLAESEYASNVKQVAALLGTLFPDFTERSYPGTYGVGSQNTPISSSSASGSGPSSASGSSSASGGSFERPTTAAPPPEALTGFDIDVERSSISRPSEITGAPTSPFMKTVLVVGGLGLLAAVGTIGYLLARRPAQTEVAQKVAPKQVVPPGADANATAKAYLDEVERLDRSHRFKTAVELLGKAAAAHATDAAVNIRLAKLQDQVEVDAALASGARYLAANDTAKAIASAKDVLDRDPDNAAALALLKKAGRIRDAAEAKHSPHRRARRDGRLALRSTPEGALVYVDDEPVGHTPLSSTRVRAGRHRLEVRLRGYLTQDREIAIRSGRRLSLSVKLVKGGRRHLAAAEVAEASRPQGTRAIGDAAEKTPSGPELRHPATNGSPAKKPAKTAVATPSATPPAPKAATPSPTPAPAKKPAAVATTEHTAPPAAKPKAPARPRRPRLPPVYHARSLKDIARVFTVTEGEATNRGGVPASVTRQVGGPLLHALVSSYSPGTIVDLYPKAMYYLIVREANAGAGASKIAADLKRAHLSGRLETEKNAEP